MGTISDSAAFIGLKATGTPVGTNVNGTVTVGVGNTQVSFSDADIAYSFKVTSTGTSDQADLDLATGAVTASTGSPTIVDGDGNDFEGESLATLVTPLAILVQADEGNSGVVKFFHAVVGNTSDGPRQQLAPGGWVIGTMSSETMADNSFELLESRDSVTVTVVGKTT